MPSKTNTSLIVGLAGGGGVVLLVLVIMMASGGSSAPAKSPRSRSRKRMAPKMPSRVPAAGYQPRGQEPRGHSEFIEEESPAQLKEFASLLEAASEAYYRRYEEYKHKLGQEGYTPMKFERTVGRYQQPLSMYKFPESNARYPEVTPKLLEAREKVSELLGLASAALQGGPEADVRACYDATKRLVSDARAHLR